ncbi:ABC-F family ATP-binding cassette domain-containing protein [Streptomyces sp. SBT349]|uniref:ABC-F family ATP-binding cassette domain-containing protein n=1 Tax=Streptomyces sp. SBT349 TaxID=1580539 RepID=UPI00066C661A|nr:ABC-F family ATP-binding cassette domain-containing protein [Streptomyces sp. SBT349]
MSPTALLAHDLVRSFGTRRVIDDFSLTAAPGRRIGLIGENGAGKTTLLRLLAGVDTPDSGTVVRPADLGFLRQEMPFDAASTLSDVLDHALREARDQLAELDELSRALGEVAQDAPGHADLLARYGERLHLAQLHEVWDADRRAAIVLAGLGLGHLPHDRALGSLSGGQRSRLALAALLTRRPSALLLDEPTNHLDDEAAAFLEGQLRDMPGTVVAASHDRAFLDAVCTDLIDLDPAAEGPTRYGGDYTAYQARKRAERERWRQRFEREQEQLAALRRAASVTAHRVAPGRAPTDNEKMGYDRSGDRVQQQVGRRVRSAMRRLDELERAQVGRPPEPLRFRAPSLASPPLSPEGFLLSLRDVRVPGRLSIDRLDVPVTDRLLVTGPNGAGKSTLLAVLAGELDVDGEVRRRGGLTVGLLPQDTVFERKDRTARETYELALGAERAEAVPLDSLGLLGERDAEQRVGELSVGQCRRLALALLLADPPELLLLDEPTNHLSPRLCDELQEALGTGPGAIVAASHDRWLRARWTGREIGLTPR